MLLSFLATGLATCLLVALSLLPSASAAASFAKQLSATRDNMAKLHGSLDQLESVARSAGHHEIVSHCGIAKAALQNAATAYSHLSSSPQIHNQPWTVGSSPHSQTVERAIGACGAAIGRIGDRIKEKGNGCGKEVKDKYSDCQKHYTGCQGGWHEIHHWPQPPRHPNRPPHKPPHHPHQPPHNPPHNPPHHPHQPPTPPHHPHPHGPSQVFHKPPTYGQPKPGYGGRPSRERNGNGQTYKRSSVDEKHCPGSETACPVSVLSDAIECIDTSKQLASCGGCASVGEGENCLGISGAEGVGCHQGSCVVLSCSTGFFLDGRTGRCSASPRRHA